MLAFWAVVAVLVAIALVLLLPPLLKKRDTSGVVARKDLTVTVYQDQYNELENDLNNGTISQEQYDQAKIDLEKNLLEDVGKASRQDEAENAGGDTSQLANRISAAFIFLAVPVLTVSLYNLWGGGIEAIAPESIPEEERLAKQQHNQKESIQAMLAQLEERLRVDPNDGEGWFMLAKSYQFLKRYDDAVKAYAQTLPLGGNQSADVLSAYADAIAMASNRTLTEEAVNVLKQALQIDPRHIKSLWLVGTAAYQQQNYNEALKYWERLYVVLEPGSDDANQIAMNIGEVRSLLGMPPMSESQMSSVTQAPEPVESDARIQGTVSLSGEIASQASPEDIVFVFARAASGPRMPLAIIRKQVKDIPFDFTLDDSLAMNPSMKLSSVPQVIVGARISKTGNAMPQPGDLEGITAALNVSANDPVSLVINKIIQ